MKIAKLTPKERVLLRRAALLVLAGEWPWDEKNMAREIAILLNACEKLGGNVNRVDREHR